VDAQPGTKNQQLITNHSLRLAALGLLLAFAVTTIHLDRDSLALDEGWTMWAVRGDSPADMLRRVDSDVHPPLYFALLDGWIVLAGESVFAVRLFSVLCALIALAGTYAAGRRLFDAETGLIALIYLSTAGFVVYYAREARMYTLLMALSALSAWAYLRWREKPSRANTVIYAALLAGLVYTHYQGAWIVLAHGAHAGLSSARRRSWIGVLALALVYFSPWLPTLIEQMREHPVMEFGARPTTWKEIRWLFFLLTDLYWPLLIVPFALGNALPRLRRNPDAAALLALWIVLPPVIILAINAWIRPSYQPRYVITILPAIAIGVAYAIRQMHWRPLAYGLVAALTVTHLAAYTELWPIKAPWEAAIMRLVKNRQPGDSLISLIDDHSVAAYYDRQLGLRRGNTLDLSGQNPDPVALRDQLRAVDSAPSVWIAMSLNAPVTWDVALILDRGRRVGARDAISVVGGIDNTIFYRFDAEPQDTDDLRFRFGDVFVFDGETGIERSVSGGEQVCFDLPLRALRDVDGRYSAGLHVLDRERVIAAQVDAGLGTHAAGDDFTFAACLAAPAEAGVYTPILAVYDWASVENLPVYEGTPGQRFVWGKWLVLGTLIVEGRQLAVIS
jgi:hypothetical protein